MSGAHWSATMRSAREHALLLANDLSCLGWAVLGRVVLVVETRDEDW